MTIESIREAIESSRKREKRRGKLLEEWELVEVAAHRYYRAEYRFRDALETILNEVVTLMPKRCECTPTWICPYCCLNAAIKSAAQVLAGEQGGGG